jgi:ferredoxin
MFVITAECVNCAICVDVCPVDAIVEGEGQFVITSACIDCGECVTVCPIDAIKGTK